MNRFVSRFVYTTCYTVSYGVVFPSVLLARSIPKNNPIVHGLIDGAHAATDMVEEMRKRKLEAKAARAESPRSGHCPVVMIPPMEPGETRYPRRGLNLGRGESRPLQNRFTALLGSTPLDASGCRSDTIGKAIS